MKKLSFMLLSLLAMTMFTACNDNNDEPSTKQTFSSYVNSRAIDGDDIVYSQGSGKVELNYSDMFIKFTSEYKDANGQTQTLTTSDMKMNKGNGTVYTFNNAASSTYTGIQDLEGSIDFSTGMMWYSFVVDGSTRVVSTTCLQFAYSILYAYSNTNMVNPESGNHGTHQQSAYLFAPDARCETCIMKIFNFMSNMNGAVDAPEIQYSDLTVTPTINGYIITADRAESNYKGFYTLTDVQFTLDNQCKTMSGSFKCNGINYEINGGMFSYNNIELY